MARRGRKRKIINREPNGRAKRSLQPLADVRTVAMNQPHRKGSASDRLASPVGRLIERSGYHTTGLSKNGLYESAKRFEKAYAKWRSSIGAKHPFANSSSLGSADETLWNAGEKELVKAWRKLRKAGEMIEKATLIAIIDPQEEDWRPPHWIVYGCIEGLKVLAAHYGVDIDGEDVNAPIQGRRAA